MSGRPGAVREPRVYAGETGAGLPAELRRGLEHAGWEALVPRGARVAVKPNLCWPEPLPGVTTSPAMLDALLAVLVERTDRIAVVESDGISFSAEAAFAAHDVPAIAARHGAQVVNLSDHAVERRRTEVAGRIVELDHSAYLLREIDVLISLTVLKTHVITGARLSLKNLWGTLPDSMRVLAHHKLAPGIVALASELRPALGIVDATWGLDRRGPVFGDPVPVGRLIVADSLLAADVAGCRLLGFDPETVEHLALAARAGLGRLDLEACALAGVAIEPAGAFSVEPTAMERAANLTYRSRAITRLIHGSRLSPPIYAVARRALPVPNRHSPGRRSAG